MADNIKVVIKVRPLIKREVDDNAKIFWKINNNSILPVDGRDNGYIFDRIFSEESNTQTIYDEIAQNIVESSLAGINGTIFAYGQTSSGKTYAMMGNEDSPGLIPLAVHSLFEMIQTFSDRDFLLRVSYIEIYNEKIIDLFDLQNKDIKIFETSNGVKINAAEKVTSSPEQVLRLMKMGERNRHVGGTNMNERSSRSHTIFQIIIESKEHSINGEEDDESVNVSQLNLVDLAGSERAGQTGATGQRLKEGAHINKSLSTLSMVIKQLADVQGDPNRFISFRDSKLTRILQTSLGGNAKTAIICAVTPACLEETHSTLQFASRAKSIQNKPEVNTIMNDATMLKTLTKKLTTLQKELDSKKDLETDNKLLTDKIKDLQAIILNSFRIVDASGDVDTMSKKRKSNRRQTWCPSSSSHSRFRQLNLQVIEENDCSDKNFMNSLITPTLQRYKCEENNPHRSSCLSNISEMSDETDADSKLETTSYSGRKTPEDKKSLIEIVNNEVICLDDTLDNKCVLPNVKTKAVCESPLHVCYDATRTPPCVLKESILKSKQEYDELVEMTTLERLHPGEIGELMKGINYNQKLILKIENALMDQNVILKEYETKFVEKEEILTIKKDELGDLQQLVQEVQEKNNVIAILEDKILNFQQLNSQLKNTETERNAAVANEESLQSKIEELQTKLAETEIRMEMLQSKANRREQELLEFLNDGKFASNRSNLLQNSADKNFLEISSDMSFFKSDDDMSGLENKHCKTNQQTPFLINEVATITNASAAHEDAIAEVAKLQEIVESNKKSLDEYESTVNELHLALSQKEDDISQAKSLLQINADKIFNYTKQVTRLTEDNHSYENLVKDLRKSPSQKDDVIYKLQKEVKSLRLSLTLKRNDVNVSFQTADESLPLSPDGGDLMLNVKYKKVERSPISSSSFFKEESVSHEDSINSLQSQLFAIQNEVNIKNRQISNLQDEITEMKSVDIKDDLICSRCKTHKEICGNKTINDNIDRFKIEVSELLSVISQLIKNDLANLSEAIEHCTSPSSDQSSKNTLLEQITNSLRGTEFYEDFASMKGQLLIVFQDLEKHRNLEIMHLLQNAKRVSNVDPLTTVGDNERELQLQFEIDNLQTMLDNSIKQCVNYEHLVTRTYHTLCKVANAAKFENLNSASELMLQYLKVTDDYDMSQLVNWKSIQDAVSRFDDENLALYETKRSLQHDVDRLKEDVLLLKTENNEALHGMAERVHSLESDLQNSIKQSKEFENVIVSLYYKLCRLNENSNVEQVPVNPSDMCHHVEVLLKNVFNELSEEKARTGIIIAENKQLQEKTELLLASKEQLSCEIETIKLDNETKDNEKMEQLGQIDALQITINFDKQINEEYRKIILSIQRMIVNILDDNSFEEFKIENNNLKEVSQRLSDYLESVRTKLHENVSKVNILTMELKDVQDANMILENSKCLLENGIESQMQQNNILEKEKSQQFDELNEKITIMEKTLENSKSQHAQYENYILTVYQKLSEIIYGRNKELPSCESSHAYRCLEELLESVNIKLNENSNTLMLFKDELQTLQKHNESLKDRNCSLESLTEILEREKISLIDENKRLLDESVRTESKKNQLNDYENVVKTIYAKLLNAFENDVNDGCEIFDINIAHHKIEELLTLKREYDEQSHNLQILCEDFNAVKKINAELTASKNTLENDKEALEEKLDLCEQKTKLSDGKVLRLEESLESNITQVKKLRTFAESIYNRLDLKIANSQQAEEYETDSFDFVYRHLESLFSGLQSELEKKMQDVDSLMLELDKLHGRNEELRTNIGMAELYKTKSAEELCGVKELFECERKQHSRCDAVLSQLFNAVVQHSGDDLNSRPDLRHADLDERLVGILTSLCSEHKFQNEGIEMEHISYSGDSMELENGITFSHCAIILGRYKSLLTILHRKLHYLICTPECWLDCVSGSQLPSDYDVHDILDVLLREVQLKIGKMCELLNLINGEDGQILNSPNTDNVGGSQIAALRSVMLVCVEHLGTFREVYDEYQCICERDNTCLHGITTNSDFVQSSRNLEAIISSLKASVDELDIVNRQNAELEDINMESLLKTQQLHDVQSVDSQIYSQLNDLTVQLNLAHDAINKSKTRCDKLESQLLTVYHNLAEPDLNSDENDLCIDFGYIFLSIEEIFDLISYKICQYEKNLQPLNKNSINQSISPKGVTNQQNEKPEQHAESEFENETEIGERIHVEDCNNLNSLRNILDVILNNKPTLSEESVQSIFDLSEYNTLCDYLQQIYDILCKRRSVMSIVEVVDRKCEENDTPAFEFSATSTSITAEKYTFNPLTHNLSDCNTKVLDNSKVLSDAIGCLGKCNELEDILKALYNSIISTAEGLFSTVESLTVLPWSVDNFMLEVEKLLNAIMSKVSEAQHLCEVQKKDYFETLQAYENLRNINAIQEEQIKKSALSKSILGNDKDQLKIRRAEMESNLCDIELEGCDSIYSFEDMQTFILSLYKKLHSMLPEATQKNDKLGCFPLRSNKHLDELAEVFNDVLHLIDAEQKRTRTESDSLMVELKSLTSLIEILSTKIVSHQSNLSTLQATYYAENKLLQSQIATLTYRHSQLHEFCGQNLSNMKQQLKYLLPLFHPSCPSAQSQETVSLSSQDFSNNSFTNSTLRNSSSVNVSLLSPRDAEALDQTGIFKICTDRRVNARRNLQVLPSYSEANVSVQNATRDNEIEMADQIRPLKLSIEQLKSEKFDLISENETLSAKLMDCLQDCDDLESKLARLQSGKEQIDNGTQTMECDDIKATYPTSHLDNQSVNRVKLNPNAETQTTWEIKYSSVAVQSTNEIPGTTDTDTSTGDFQTYVTEHWNLLDKQMINAEMRIPHTLCAQYVSTPIKGSDVNTDVTDPPNVTTITDKSVSIASIQLNVRNVSIQTDEGLAPADYVNTQNDERISSSDAPLVQEDVCDVSNMSVARDDYSKMDISYFEAGAELEVRTALEALLKEIEYNFQPNTDMSVLDLLNLFTLNFKNKMSDMRTHCESMVQNIFCEKEHCLDQLQICKSKCDEANVKLADVEDYVANLNSKNQSLEASVNRLLEDLERAKESNAITLESQQRLEIVLKEEEKNNLALSNANEKLSSDIDIEKVNCSRLLRSNQKVTEDLEVEREKYASLLNADRNLLHNLEMEKENTSRLEKTILDNQNNLQKIQMQLEDATSQLNIVKEENVTNVSKLLSLKEDYDRLKDVHNKCSDYQNHLSKVQTKIVRKDKEIESLKSDVQMFKQMCSKKDQQISSFETINKHLQQKITEGIKEQIEIINIMEMEKGKLLKEHGNYKIITDEEKKVLAHEIKALTDKLQAFKGSDGRSGSGTEVERLKTENKRLSADLEDIKSKLCGAEAKLAETEERCKELDEECDMCLEKINECSMEITNLLGIRKTLQTRVSELQAEVDSYFSNTADIPMSETRRRRQSMHDLNRLSVGSDHAIEEMKSNPGSTSVLDAKDKEINELRESMGILKSDKDSYLATVKSLEKNCSKKTYQLHSTQLKYKKLKDKVVEGQAKLLELQNKYDSLEKQFNVLHMEHSICAVKLQEDSEINVSASMEVSELNIKKLKMSEDHRKGYPDERNDISRCKRQNLHDSRRKITYDVSTNTDAEWKGRVTHAIDKMAYESEIEKNRSLQASLEEQKRKNRTLSAEFKRLQQSIDSNQCDENTIQILKNRQQPSIEDLEVQLKQMETMIKHKDEVIKDLRRDISKQCGNKFATLRNVDSNSSATIFEKDQPSMSKRSSSGSAVDFQIKRQTAFDQNRINIDAGFDFCSNTEESKASQSHKDVYAQLAGVYKELRLLKQQTGTISFSTSLELRITQVLNEISMKNTPTATGSSVVEGQKLAECFLENRRLKKVNTKLIEDLKRAKSAGQRL